MSVRWTNRRCLALTTVLTFAFLLCNSVRVSADGNNEADRTHKFSKKYREVEDLRKRLLEGYDHVMYPPTEKDEPTAVAIHMILRHFSLEETNHVFQIHGYLTQGWRDERLSWNSTSADVVYFEDDELWKPEIAVYNEAYVPDTQGFGKAKVEVTKDGYVTWAPPFRFDVLCALNMIKWPRDSHTCFVKLLSRSYDSNIVVLRELEDSIHIDDAFTINSEWMLRSYTVWNNKTEEHNESFADFTFVFEVERRSPAYTATFVVPAYVIAFVNLMIFLLPPTSGEKLTLAAVNLFIVSQYLLYFEGRLPALGDHLPLLVLLYVTNFVLLGFTIFISIIVIYLSRTRRASGIPPCLRLIFNMQFARALGLGYLVPYVSQTHVRLSDGVEMRSPRQNGHTPGFSEADKDDCSVQCLTGSYDNPYVWNAEWILFASMIDRISFIVLTVLTGIFLALMA